MFIARVSLFNSISHPYVCVSVQFHTISYKVTDKNQTLGGVTNHMIRFSIHYLHRHYLLTIFCFTRKKTLNLLLIWFSPSAFVLQVIQQSDLPMKLNKPRSTAGKIKTKQKMWWKLENSAIARNRSARQTQLYQCNVYTPPIFAAMLNFCYLPSYIWIIKKASCVLSVYDQRKYNIKGWIWE